MTKAAYLAVKNRLEENFQGYYIDKFNNQFEKLEGNQLPFSLPCLLIGTEGEITYSGEGQGNQMGTGLLSIHVGVEIYNNSILDYFDAKEKVYDVLEGFVTDDDNIAFCSRVSDEDDQDHKNFYVYKRLFNFQFYSFRSIQEQTLESPTFTIAGGLPFNINGI